METFVVRLWTAASADPGVGDRVTGFVQHVKSGRTVAFHTREELVAAIASWATTVHVDLNEAPDEAERS
jgi:hypothetical protein